jgi:hypothetical protein
MFNSGESFDQGEASRRAPDVSVSLWKWREESWAIQVAPSPDRLVWPQRTRGDDGPKGRTGSE